jgi:hypothetical protein
MWVGMRSVTRCVACQFPMPPRFRKILTLLSHQHPIRDMWGKSATPKSGRRKKGSATKQRRDRAAPPPADSAPAPDPVVQRSSRKRKKKPKTSKQVPPEHLPTLEGLHERHYGLTAAITQAYAEAAGVCLARHHTSPTDLVIEARGRSSVKTIAWQAPDERTQAAWRNTDDATRDGAYAVSLATVEAEYGWVALERAETRTGADYYVGPLELAADLESQYRLEIAGANHGDRASVANRLARKVRQLRSGLSDLPAVAAVVGFEGRLVMMREVEPDGD